MNKADDLLLITYIVCKHIKEKANVDLMRTMRFLNNLQQSLSKNWKAK